MKLDEASSKFEGRQEVWATKLRKLLAEQDNGSIISQVLQKMRRGLGPESFGYNSIWILPSAKQYRPIWLKVQQLFVAAVLYHSDILEECDSFISLSDDRCAEIAANLTSTD